MTTMILIIGFISIGTCLTWLFWYLKGRRFALRNHLQKADAIVVLAGTRGSLEFLDGKIRTAVNLYHQGWAPYIICSGKFSVKVDDKAPDLIPLHELHEAFQQGRIQKKDIANAAKKWDRNLGAVYLRDQALALNVPSESILIEDESLHTRENAAFVLHLLKKSNLSHIIIVTSPFHQLRTYLTFKKVLQPYGIIITNYYADTGEWHPFSWFLSKKHRNLVKSEVERIQTYRKKGDLL
ncbi:YdcF family protein [Hazenella sp. IB182357]|uniref:YdcF family protein n=1 Tax=Polycladospora coralii TaxID=2771432 RepID=A0A926N750_9BACL|nr:YdcF family protein [Polycladospora coralii]MBD1373894.1 YdcF family protein [Polycladospora coralii]MBS7529542.1 YdcF family protein [Polycladospora coralii]